MSSVATITTWTCPHCSAVHHTMLDPSEYEMCPSCHSSFSFAKPQPEPEKPAEKPIDTETLKEWAEHTYDTNENPSFIDLGVDRQNLARALLAANEELTHIANQWVPIAVHLSALAEAKAEIAEVTKERDAYRAEADSLYSEDPCPNCGATITGGCWGCLLKASQERCAALEAALVHMASEAHRLRQYCPDSYSDAHTEERWRECPAVCCVKARAALASPSEPAGGRKE